MAKKKKKGSQRARPKIPGTSHFARISSLPLLSSVNRGSGLAAPPRPLVSAPSGPVAEAPTSSPEAASSDLPPQPDSVSVPGNFALPPEISSASSSGLSPAAVEVPTSGLASPALAAAPSQILPPDSGLPSSGKKWSALFQDASQLEEVGSPSQHITGVPFVLIPDENIAEAREEFKDFIFAQFHGNSPDMGRVIGVVNALWARSGPRIFVHNLGSGAFLLRVSNPRTRSILLGRNVWNIAGFPMFVSPWSPDFTPESPPITSASIMVEFRGVPYLLFNKQSLSRLATAVGKPISLAPETERKESFEVAKVLVCVDLTKPLPSKVISGFSNGREVEIDVSYPWLPPKCSECSEFGHNSNSCPSKPTTHSSLGRASRRSRSRPRLRRRSRQGRSSERWIKAPRQSSSSQLVWKVKEASDKGLLVDEQAPQALEAASVDILLCPTEASAQKNHNLEVMGEGNLPPATVEAVELTAHAESIISHTSTSLLQGEQVVEDSEVPFILVSRRRSGRKVTLSY